jgi:lysine 2,3-aminomutase
MKILSDGEWVDALTAVTDRGRSMHKSVALVTHFNHPREITGITAKALNTLFELGIRVRNQSVTLRGVNDDAATLIELNRRLSYLNVRPYYQYLGDMVRGTEDLRTTLAEAVELEKRVRGALAGHNTPAFVVDLPGGGGKRDIHSYEYYDRDSGVSVYRAPSVRSDELFLYADPLRALSPEARDRWRSPGERKAMVEAALRAAGSVCGYRR